MSHGLTRLRSKPIAEFNMTPCQTNRPPAILRIAQNLILKAPVPSLSFSNGTSLLHSDGDRKQPTNETQNPRKIMIEMKFQTNMKKSSRY